MKLIKYVIISIICVIFVCPVNAQVLKAATFAQKNEIRSNIVKVSASTNSLECNFTQKKIISVLSETFVSDGIMCFKKQNNLRWQYNKPYKYLFVLSGAKVLIKNESRTDKFDANTNKMFKEISEIMIGCVNGTMLTNETKFSSQYFVGQNGFVVKMTPKNKELKRMMNIVSLTFSKTDWSVQTIEMVEQGGDKTIINFTTKNVNKTISDDLFRIN